ncbi:hypothetical protein KRM28CT15_20630 [Krasilnikovia sp. M28-CT-15]
MRPAAPLHPVRGISPAAGRATLGRLDATGPRSGRLSMNGWLMWGLFLPILLVIAGIITLRRKNGR